MTDPRPRTQQEATEASVVDACLAAAAPRDSLSYRAAASGDFEAALANALRGPTCWTEMRYAIEKAIADPSDRDRRAALWQTLAQAQSEARAADALVTRIRAALDRAYCLSGQAARMEADEKTEE
jgi:hypothetical protein